MSNQIPIVSLKPIVDGQTGSDERVARDLKAALGTWGVIYWIDRSNFPGPLFGGVAVLFVLGVQGFILALVGAINVPVIHFSVEWWSSLHQGASVLRADGPAMPPVYLTPLLLMALGYSLLFGALWLVRIRAELWRRKARTLSLQAAGR